MRLVAGTSSKSLITRLIGRSYLVSVRKFATFPRSSPADVGAQRAPPPLPQVELADLAQVELGSQKMIQVGVALLQHYARYRLRALARNW